MTTLFSFDRKLNRAKQHLQALQSEIARWHGDAYEAVILNRPSTCNPYRIVEELDANTGEHVVKIELHRPLPIKLAVLIGDCLYNLRSSLDHLAYALVAANHSGCSIPVDIITSSEFPIFIDRSKYLRQGKNKIRGIAPAAQTIIDSLQPYNGGPDGPVKSLWTLQELTNIDKHRMLHLTLAVQCLGLRGGKQRFTLAPRDDIELVSFDITVGGPFENETQIIRYRGHTLIENLDVQVDFQVLPLVVFGQLPVKGEIVVDLLGEIAYCIEQEVFGRLRSFV